VTDYRVDLPNFSGPMDLLLHLVKQQEVDLHEISIHRILEGYMVYLKALETLDLNNIGEFVVMASTLMEIKSRELIPREDVDLSEELDPRDELIQQLLEYQRYREITLRLEERGQDREQLVPRGSFGADTREIKELADEERDKEIEESLDMEDLDVWFLLKAYHKLLEETEFGKSFTVEADKKPMAVYLDELIERLTPPETWKPADADAHFERPFRELFDRKEGRMGIIGTFMALLELVKQGRIHARQEELHGEIVLALRNDDEVVEAGPMED
jgi:segregation and condensation protein A